MKRNSLKQQGFTLVELLVGGTLSLFVAGIALTYFVSSAQSFKVQTNDSFLQENARFALEIISQNARLSGLSGLNPANRVQIDSNIIYTASTCPNDESGFSAGDNDPCTADELANGSDRFGFEYQNETGAQTCNGQNVAGAVNSRLASVFWTAANGTGIRSLYCQTYDVNAGVAVGDRLPLVDGIDRVQVQYGVDTDEDQIIDIYKPFSDFNGDDRLNIKTIRVAVLVSAGVSNADVGALADNAEESKLRTYTLLDAPPIAITDQTFRQVFSSTFMLPNGL